MNKITYKLIAENENHEEIFRLIYCLDEKRRMIIKSGEFNARYKIDLISKNDELYNIFKYEFNCLSEIIGDQFKVQMPLL